MGALRSGPSADRWRVGQDRRYRRMKLGIGGLVALVLGIGALVDWWWFVVEVLQGLVAIGLVLGGALAVAIAARKMYRARVSAEQQE